MDIPPCFYRISIKWLILDEEWKFLLCKESTGMWDFPGGGLDEWEDARDWLQREIHEEMWLETISIWAYPSYFPTDNSLSGKPIANIFYETKLSNFEFKSSDECQEIGFFSKDQAEKIPIFSNVVKFLNIYNPKKHVHL